MRELYLTSSNTPTGSGVLPSSTIPAALFFPDRPDAEGGASLPWYALSVKHQHEKAIEAALRHKGFDAFAPMYRSRRKWSDRTKEIELPLFSGYVFCRFAHEAKVNVLNTPAISRVVDFGGVPAAIPDAEIEAIRTIVNSDLPTRPWPNLKPGDRVRVERGPLRGVEGTLVKEKDALELVVSVELLQRAVAVHVEATSVVPVAPQSIARRCLNEWRLCVHATPDRLRLAFRSSGRLGRSHRLETVARGIPFRRNSARSESERANTINGTALAFARGKVSAAF
jgi:transcription antitermination factor NusG